MSEIDPREEATFAAIGLAVGPSAPPPGLRERILASTRRPAVVQRAPWRMPLGAVAALIVVALLAGVVVGDRIGASSNPPPPSQVGHFALTGHGSMDGASATVIDLKQDGISLVTFYGLPPVPSGKLYEIWLITPANQAVPAGVFLPDENGQRLVVIEKPLKGYKLMAVTVEDAPSGVDQPTQQPQLLGTVA
jgi:anti-sigma-K factor RskA